jgi:hypothetical protein
MSHPDFETVDQRISELLQTLREARGGEWVIRSDDKGDFILIARR